MKIIVCKDHPGANELIEQLIECGDRPGAILPLSKDAMDAYHETVWISDNDQNNLLHKIEFEKGSHYILAVNEARIAMDDIVKALAAIPANINVLRFRG